MHVGVGSGGRLEAGRTVGGGLQRSVGKELGVRSSDLDRGFRILVEGLVFRNPAYFAVTGA